MDDKEIILTAESLKRFKKAYEQAVKDEHRTFIFDDNLIVTSYAKYLIEFAEGEFKRRGIR